MDLAALAGLATRASIVLLVFSLGLRATQEDALYLLSRPGQLVGVPYLKWWGPGRARLSPEEENGVRGAAR